MKYRRSAFTFYAIALALAVLARLAVPLVGEASLLLTMLTPAIAVVIMLIFVAPEGGFRAALKGLGLAAAGLKGWLPAIAAPALIHAVGLALLAGAGLTMLTMPAGGASADLVLNIIAGLAIGALLALCEEAGWRGYMLPRLQDFGAVTAMLIVGLLHGLWHLPLLLTTDYYHSTGNPWLVTALFLTTLTLAGVFYGFLRVWTGSIWPVALAHGAANTAWNMADKMVQTKTPVVTEYLGGESGLIMICGLLLIDILLIRLMRKPA